MVPKLLACRLGSFAAVTTGRFLARWVAASMSGAERCFVIGDDRRLDRVRERIAASRARATIIGWLPLPDEGSDGVLTSVLEIQQLVRELQVDRIIIAPTTTDASGVIHLIRLAKAIGVRVSVLPRVLEVVGSAVEFDEVEGMTMLGVRSFGLSRSSHILKRSFDVVLATVGLIVVGPLIAVLALLIRIDTRGPIFFRQLRVGRDGKQFRIFKFRSMVQDAEAQKEALRALNEAGDGLFKIAHDPRVTRVGSWLRCLSLDELPQVFNVLRGEIESCGPAPTRRRGGRQGDRSRSQSPAPHSWHDRSLAGLGCAGPDAGDGRDRLSVRGQLVPLA